VGTHYLKNRDTRPTIVVTLRNPDDTAYDLTGVTSVTLHIQLPGSSTVLSRAMVVDGDPTSGIARYTWLAKDWTGSPALALGDHKIEVEVVGPGTVRATFPNNDIYPYVLRVRNDLGQA
jgi:hypothetical protein